MWQRTPTQLDRVQLTPRSQATAALHDNYDQAQQASVLDVAALRHIQVTAFIETAACYYFKMRSRQRTMSKLGLFSSHRKARPGLPIKTAI